MAFDSLDIEIGASTADANGAIQSVKSSLSGLSRGANDAQDSMEELGDETTGTVARLSSLAATSGTTALAITGLSSASTGASGSLTALATSAGTAGVAIGGIAAIAAPLAATLGTMAAAAGGLATAFGSIIGTGLLAFGQQRAEQNKEQLQQIQQKIGGLKELKQTEEGLSAEQAKRLNSLQKRAEKVKETTTATGALKQTFAELRAEIKPLLVEFGQRFVPLIEDAINSVVPLVESILNAIGPLDVFKQALRDLGQAAMTAIPMAVQMFVDLGRRALPILRDLFSNVSGSIVPAFNRMVSVTEEVGPKLLGMAAAAGELLPHLLDAGVVIINTLAPAVGMLFDFLDGLAETFGRVNDAVDAPLGKLGVIAGVIGTVGVAVGSLVASAAKVVSALGGVSAVISGVSTALTVLTGPVGIAVATIAGLALLFKDDLIPVVKQVADFIRDDLIPPFKAWVEDTIEGEVMPALEEITTEFEKTADAIRDAIEPALDLLNDLWEDHGDTVMDVVDMLAGYLDRTFDNTLDILVGIVTAGLALMRGDWGSFADSVERIVDAMWSQVRNLFSTTISVIERLTGGMVSGVAQLFTDLKTDATTAIDNLAAGVRSTLNTLRGWVGAVWDMQPLSGAFETAAGAVTGDGGDGGIIPSLSSNVKDGLNKLRGWAKTAWDMHPLSAAFEGAKEEIAKEDGGIIAKLSAGVRGALNGLRGWVQTAWDMLPLSDAVEDAADAAGLDIDDFDDTARDILSRLSDWVGSAWDWASELSEAVTAPFDDALSAATDFVDELANKLAFDIDPDINFPEIPDWLGGGEEEEQGQGIVNDPVDDDNGGGDDNDNGGGDDNDNGGGDDNDNGGFDRDDVTRDDEESEQRRAISNPELATGGLVESAGLATLHAGEPVVPSAQVSDRGPAPVEVNMDSESIVSELRQLRQSVESGDTRVSERDLVRGLERLFDRRGGSL